MPEYLERLLVPFCSRQRPWLSTKYTLLDTNLLTWCELSWVEKMAAFSPAHRWLMTLEAGGGVRLFSTLKPRSLALSHAFIAVLILYHSVPGPLFSSNGTQKNRSHQDWISSLNLLVNLNLSSQRRYFQWHPKGADMGGVHIIRGAENKWVSGLQRILKR